MQWPLRTDNGNSSADERSLAVCSVHGRGQSQKYLLGVPRALAILYIHSNVLD